MKVVGLMSGTSMDGVDAACLETDGDAFFQEGSIVHVPYPKEMQWLLKALEYFVFRQKGLLGECLADSFEDELIFYFKTVFSWDMSFCLSMLQECKRCVSAQLGCSIEFILTAQDIIQCSTKYHEQAVRQALAATYWSIQDIDCIGYHGQTVYHRPFEKKTIQLGDGQSLAHSLGIPVIDQFRLNDVSLGGQGAPFAPLFHRVMALQKKQIPLVWLNCGGIANASFILGEDLNALFGFDVGPGNGLLDLYVKKKTNGALNMDASGLFAAQGQVNSVLLGRLMAQKIEPYDDLFQCVLPPKSLDIRDWELIPELFEVSLEDACATLTALSIEMMVHSPTLIGLSKATTPDVWVLSGGGAYNHSLVKGLSARLKAEFGATLWLSEALGCNNQGVEAQLMGYLAARSMMNLPLSFPKTTGVPYPCLGGTLHAP